tara:strand:- start:878 stop:1504 length:627 start_codon:yes stop_codon:yes gene_type:complete
MKKKSPKGLKGFHAWQMRWFELTKVKLAYWEVSMEGAVDEKGAVLIGDLAGVRKHVKDGERLDLLLKNGRLFQLCAPSNAERDEWAVKLQEAMVRALTPDDAGPSMDGVKESLPDDETVTEEDAAAAPEDEDKGEAIEQFAEFGRTVSKMPKKEHDVNEGVKKVEGDAADGAPEITLEVAQEAPVQTAVYMSRVQRAKMANAARAKAS